MSSRPELKIDWCSHEAAKYAVEKWHYSRTIPVSKSNHLGVWEGGTFIGSVIFSKGASSQLGAQYGLSGIECSELTRVALAPHMSPVSRIIRVALIFARKKNPGLRLIISFADTYHEHHGGIYQAGNWIYSGMSSPSKAVMLPNGYVHDLRRYNGHGDGKIVGGKVWRQPKKQLPKGARVIKMPGKHRYLMPLDDAMRKQIEPLRKPYPKRVRSVDSDTSATHAEEGGATPTRTLLQTEQP